MLGARHASHLLDILGLDVFVLDGVFDQGGQVVHPDLAEQVAAVGFDGFVIALQLVGDFLGTFAPGQVD